MSFSYDWPSSRPLYSFFCPCPLIKDPATLRLPKLKRCEENSKQTGRAAVEVKGHHRFIPPTRAFDSSTVKHVCSCRGFWSRLIGQRSSWTGRSQRWVAESFWLAHRSKRFDLHEQAGGNIHSLIELLFPEFIWVQRHNERERGRGFGTKTPTTCWEPVT